MPGTAFGIREDEAEGADSFVPAAPAIQKCLHGGRSPHGMPVKSMLGASPSDFLRGGGTVQASPAQACPLPPPDQPYRSIHNTTGLVKLVPVNFR